MGWKKVPNRCVECGRPRITFGRCLRCWRRIDPAELARLRGLKPKERAAEFETAAIRSLPKWEFEPPEDQVEELAARYGTEKEPETPAPTGE